jgi:hypothetical protein
MLTTTRRWKRAYEQSFDTTNAPQVQIAAAAERAGKEGKLLLLCVDLCKFMHVPGKAIISRWPAGSP